MKEHILVVDDSVELRMLVKSALTRAEYRVSELEDNAGLRQWLAAEKKDVPDLVLLDLVLGDGNSLELMPDIFQQWPGTEVIVITGYGTVDNAVKAMKAGAYGFLPKPFEVNTLLQEVTHALEHRRLRARAQGLQQVVSTLRAETAPVFQSEPMKRLVRLVERAAAGPLPVLITGESGVGKEVIAGMLHHLSPRAGQPLVRCNCPAFSADQLERALFGGGDAAQEPGYLRLAGAGTLLLDEISALPWAVQGRLMGVLQDNLAQPVGGQTYPVQCRLVATTNRPLPELLQKGLLKEDFYYRLSQITLEVPPLRERRDDILPLASAFLERYGSQSGRSFEGFTERARQALRQFDWPGNVRQLQNEIQRAVLMAQGTWVDRDDLTIAPHPAVAEPELGLLEVMERKSMIQALQATQGNVAEAARRLHMGRQTFQLKMKAYRIET
jgi:DNA-binding NtrC family response regulator